MELLGVLKRSLPFLLFVFQFNGAMESFECLKGTHSSLNGTPYRGLTPLSGATGWHSDWIAGLHTYGDSSHATIQLVKTLFVAESGELLPSLSLHNPPYLLFSLHLFPQMIQLKVKNILHDEEIYHEALVVPVLNYYREWGCKTDSKMAQKVKVLDKKLRRLKNQMVRFVEMIVAAQNECESGLYPEHTVDQIISSYYYVVTRYAQSPELLKRYVEPLGIEFDHQDCYSPKGLGEIQEVFRIGSRDDIAAILDSDMERASVARLAEVAQPAGFPVCLQYGRYAYGLHSKKVTNCVETFIHNLFNFILYDPVAHLYNVEYMPQIPERLTVFYTGINSTKKFRAAADQTNLSETRQAWMDCLSGIKDAEIVYNEKDAYGVRSNVENVLRLFSVLFKKEITSFEDLAPYLSHEALGRTVQIKKVSSQEYRVLLHDIHYDKEGSFRQMSFFVRDWHSWVKFYTIKDQSRHELVDLLGDDYEHLQMKLLVDSPIPVTDDVLTLEYIMYSKKINEDILDEYVFEMIAIIKSERSLKQHAKRLLRWLFQLQFSSEEEDSDAFKKITCAFNDLDEPEFLSKFLVYFYAHCFEISSTAEAIACAKNFVF
jgi:hypothetical protein